MSGSGEDILLKKELLGLFGHIQRIRKELAAIRPSSTNPDHFHNMADLLDDIVASTENATNTIMESMEGIEGLITQAKGRIKDPETNALLDQVIDKSSAVFEACSFQDLTGQRVTKTVQSLKFIEERVNSLIFMWGKDELEKVVVEIKEELDPDKKLLNGPQRPNAAISQADVDKLFSQDDIDKLFG